MKAASITDIRKELVTRKPAEIMDICLRLGRFKKENKELLTYLLFEASDEAGYLASVKAEIDEQMSQINFSHLYFVKKSLRKILRLISKHVRYMGAKEAEADLLVYFLTAVKDADIKLKKNQALLNLYNLQLKKLAAVVSTLHEDIQFDYALKLERLG
ncbi:MAG: hypothetical protein H7Y27_07650 [Gemmatimonadaceae bacterium]|nr:hypothetical protein [Chitinophagaceae bacterium]